MEATGTLWPMKPEIFTIRLLRKVLANTCFRRAGACLLLPMAMGFGTAWPALSLSLVATSATRLSLQEICMDLRSPSALTYPQIWHRTEAGTNDLGMFSPRAEPFVLCDGSLGSTASVRYVSRHVRVM